MRKQSIFVHGYQRRPFHMYGSYVDEPKRTIEHWRKILVDTEQDISKGLEAEKKSRKQLEDELVLAKKNAQVELEKAIEEQNQAKIRSYRRQQELIDTEAQKLKSETEKVKQFQDLRDQMSRHLYAKGSPLSQQMANLHRKRELENVKAEILEKRIGTRKAMAELVDKRAQTIVALRAQRAADTTAEVAAAQKRLEIAEKAKVKLPSAEKLKELTGTKATEESTKRLAELLKKEVEKPDLSFFTLGQLLYLANSRVISMAQVSEELKHRSKAEVELFKKLAKEGLTQKETQQYDKLKQMKTARRPKKPKPEDMQIWSYALEAQHAEEQQKKDKGTGFTYG